MGAAPFLKNQSPFYLSEDASLRRFSRICARGRARRQLAADADVALVARRIENCDAVIRVYDEAGKVIETHEHAGEFKDL